MAPIKFEENMRVKLEKRTIQPSAKSWESLSQRLDKEEKKSNKKGFWWLGIAASAIGVLLVSNMFFNTEKINNLDTIIVDKNTKIDTLITESPLQNIKKQSISVAKNNNVINENTKSIKKKTIKKTNFIVNSTTLNKKEKSKINTVQFYKTLVIKNEPIQNKALVINNENKPEDKSINTLNSEIDALLAQAEATITKQKSKNKTVPIPLDYNGLLIAVEDDLDETFRDKMLKVVKKGYETVRGSVAERND